MIIDADVQCLGIYQTAAGVCYRCDLDTRDNSVIFWGPTDSGPPKLIRTEIRDNRESTAIEEVKRFLGEGSFIMNYFEV